MKYYQKNGLTIEKNENIRIILSNETIELNLGDALTVKSALKKAITSLTKDEINKINNNEQQKEETIEPMNMEFFNMGEEPKTTEEPVKKEFKLFDNNSKNTEYYY